MNSDDAASAASSSPAQYGASSSLACRMRLGQDGSVPSYCDVPSFSSPPVFGYGVYADRPPPRGPFFWCAKPGGDSPIHTITAGDVAAIAAIDAANDGAARIEWSASHLLPQCKRVMTFGWWASGPPPDAPYLWPQLDEAYSLILSDPPSIIPNQSRHTALPPSTPRWDEPRLRAYGILVDVPPPRGPYLWMRHPDELTAPGFASSMTTIGALSFSHVNQAAPMPVDGWMCSSFPSPHPMHLWSTIPTGYEIVKRDECEWDESAEDANDVDVMMSDAHVSSNNHAAASSSSPVAAASSSSSPSDHQPRVTRRTVDTNDYSVQYALTSVYVRDATMPLVIYRIAHNAAVELHIARLVGAEPLRYSFIRTTSHDTHRVVATDVKSLFLITGSMNYMRIFLLGNRSNPYALSVADFEHHYRAMAAATAGDKRSALQLGRFGSAANRQRAAWLEQVVAIVFRGGMLSAPVSASSSTSQYELRTMLIPSPSSTVFASSQSPVDQAAGGDDEAVLYDDRANEDMGIYDCDDGESRSNAVLADVAWQQLPPSSSSSSSSLIAAADRVISVSRTLVSFHFDPSTPMMAAAPSARGRIFKRKRADMLLTPIGAPSTPHRSADAPSLLSPTTNTMHAMISFSKYVVDDR